MLNNSKILNLCSCELIKLPTDIDIFIEELHLQFNKLTTLPKEIGNLSNLKFMLLYFNKLEYLPEDIDPEDVLSEGVTFFCHQVAYIISDDKRNGHNVRTPFGRVIKFTYQSTRQIKTGNETKLHNLSIYTRFRKKQIKWTKDHKFYGTIFFNNHSEALGTDAKKATKLARIILTLQRYDVHKILRIAKSLDIPSMQDISALRTIIANKQADQEMSQEDAQNRLKVREAIIDKQILNSAE